MMFHRSLNGRGGVEKYPKPQVLPAGALLAMAALAFMPLSVTAAVDPFEAFPYGAEDASDPRIEALREALRPEAFSPVHEVVITDALFFRWSGMRKYVKNCGGDPTMTIGLPKEDTVATSFRANFESPESPIRAYAGDGYACTFPAKFGPLDLGADRPVVQGLISYADGSYWLGYVSGAGNPESRESVWNPISTLLTPTPAGFGEWGRADGTRVQGEARIVAVPMWPKTWASASVVGFAMTSIRRTAMPGELSVATNLMEESPEVAAAPALRTPTRVPESTPLEPAPAAAEAALVVVPMTSPSATEAETTPAPASRPAGPSRLAGFLTSSTVTASTPTPTTVGTMPSDTTATLAPPRSALAGFLEQAQPAADRPRHVPQGGFSALVDGRLVAAQADYQEEQRILREREEARRRAEEAERLAREAARRAEQERIARLERQRAEQQASQSSGFLGSVLGMVAGAAIGAEMGLDANQALEMASTFGDIGRAVETGDASDAMAARSSVDSFGARLDGVSPQVSAGSFGVGTGTESTTAVNQRTGGTAGGNDGAVVRSTAVVAGQQERLASNSSKASRTNVQSQQFRAYSDQCGQMSRDVMSMKVQADRCVGGGGGAFNSSRELRAAEARCDAEWRPRIEAMEANYRARCGSVRPGAAVGNQ